MFSRLVPAAALCLVATSGTPVRAADELPAGVTPCERCAVVKQVRRAARHGEPTALGTLGGAFGHRFGADRGGDAGGAVAGSWGREIDLRGRRYSVWITTVKLEGGKTRSFETSANPALRPGDVVVVEDATLRRHIPEPAAR